MKNTEDDFIKENYGLAVSLARRFYSRNHNYDFEDMFVLMINSGIALLCLGNNLNYDPDYIPKAVRAICSAIEKNRISTERINESIDRIASLKKKYNLYE